MPRITARLSDESRRGWDKTGSTLTALIEAMGLAMNRGEWMPPPELLAEADRIGPGARLPVLTASLELGSWT